MDFSSDLGQLEKGGEVERRMEEQEQTERDKGKNEKETNVDKEKDWEGREIHKTDKSGKIEKCKWRCLTINGARD